jgi:hypothetical protein
VTERAELVTLLSRLLFIVWGKVEVTDNGRLEGLKDGKVRHPVLLALEARGAVDNGREQPPELERDGHNVQVRVRCADHDGFDEGKRLARVHLDNVAVALAGLGEHAAVSAYPVWVVGVLVQLGTERNEAREDHLDHVHVVLNLLCLVDEVADDVHRRVEQGVGLERIEHGGEQGALGNHANGELARPQPAAHSLKDLGLDLRSNA